MRNWIDIVNEDRIDSRDDILTAIFLHVKQQIDPDITRSEFNRSYHDLMSHLQFPLKIYRALSFPDHGLFDIRDHDLGEYEDREALKALIRSIDFKRIGLSWTFNRESAVAGGVLGGGGFNNDGAHVIVEATVGAKQIDMLSTLYQNLTVYQEEQEVCLKPHIPILIIGITPELDFKLPIQANTGPEGHDNHDGRMHDLLVAMGYHR